MTAEFNDLFEAFFNDFTKSFFDVNVNDKVDDVTTHSKFVKDEYANGEHVKHSEKEYKNGRLVNQKTFDNTKKISTGCSNSGCDCNDLKHRIAKLTTKNENLASEVKTLKNKNEEISEAYRVLEKKLKETESDKNKLLLMNSELNEKLKNTNDLNERLVRIKKFFSEL